ncbi:rod-binding protein [Magnetospira sp. QH-2]|uniref:rod-binding protein n=1 Tax=Magnetospira sp. (strain QH-2) TaxID=1288970 RepID=UPI0003E8161D|nr:rod-binding protein [Magnetospira sp. QH-2]CCQ74133.1 Flagellar protein FlgJ, N-terminal [Magnetospira sp. QH-2]
MTGTDLMAAQMENALMAGKALQQPKPTANLGRMREVAEDFEAVFLGQMLQPMFNSIGAEEPFGGGHAEKVWRSMMVDEFGKQMAKSGGVGIADSIMRQMILMQEKAQ